MEYESETIDRAIYGGNLNIDDFQTTEHRIQLIFALLDQWGVKQEDKGKAFEFLKNIMPNVE